jgi:transcription elongation factor GreA
LIQLKERDHQEKARFLIHFCMSGEYLITFEGFERLKQELSHLKEVERPQVINAISTSRALGDLSENAEYHGAKQRQAQVESKISILEKISVSAKVVDTKTLPKDVVQFGSKVKLLDLAKEKETTLSIVSEYEIDLSKGMISHLSPIGKALLGAKVGEVVEVQKPNELCEYEVLAVL